MKTTRNHLRKFRDGLEKHQSTAAVVAPTPTLISSSCSPCVEKDFEIQELRSAVQEQRSAVQELQDENKRLKDQIFKRSSEKTPKELQKRDPKDPKDPKDRKPAPSTRVRLLSEQYPRLKVVEELIQDPHPPLCKEGCGKPLVDSGLREASERMEHIPAQKYIRRSLRVKYHCKQCQIGLYSAPAPQRLAPGTALGDSLIIHASISKFHDLISTCRSAKISVRENAAIPHKMLLRAQSILAGVLSKVHQKIKDDILKSRIICADETTHRQLEDHGDKYSWYLWSFGNQRAVYFEIHNTRAGEVSINFLMDSSATFLVSDCYSGYDYSVNEVNKVRTKKGLPILISAYCNDHGRRYFFKSQFEDPLAKAALDQYNEIYDIERKVQKLLLQPQSLEPQNSAQALLLRQTADVHFKEIYSLSVKILEKSPTTSAEFKAARYFCNNQEGLRRYLLDIELPISNAVSERALRDAVILRKISLGNHSQEGAREAAIHLSVMGSCKLAKVNPQ